MANEDDGHLPCVCSYDLIMKTQAKTSAWVVWRKKMRRITSEDTFRAIRLVKAAGIKNEIKKMAQVVEQMQKEKKEIDIEEIGCDFFLSVIDGMADEKAEELLYQLISGPLEIEPTEVKKMSLWDLKEKIRDLIRYEDPDGWRNFFKLLGDSIKRS